MTAPSVPTAEEFAKAREAYQRIGLQLPHKWHRHPGRAAVCPNCEDMQTLRSTLVSAEAAIERLSKEAARWDAVRDDLAVDGDSWGWRIVGNNYDAYPNPLPANVDEAADRLASPPESEKP